MEKRFVHFSQVIHLSRVLCKFSPSIVHNVASFFSSFSPSIHLCDVCPGQPFYSPVKIVSLMFRRPQAVGKLIIIFDAVRKIYFWADGFMTGWTLKLSDSSRNIPPVNGECFMAIGVKNLRCLRVLLTCSTHLHQTSSSPPQHRHSDITI